jgi:hypothetical protein
VVPHNLLTREVSPVEKPTLIEIPSSKARKLKGKKLVFSPPVAVETVKSRRPFTRSTAKQHVPMEDDTAEASAQQKDKVQFSKKPWRLLISALLLMKVTLLSKDSGGNLRMQKLKLTS